MRFLPLDRCPERLVGISNEAAHTKVAYNRPPDLSQRLDETLREPPSSSPCGGLPGRLTDSSRSSRLAMVKHGRFGEYDLYSGRNFPRVGEGLDQLLILRC